MIPQLEYLSSSVDETLDFGKTFSKMLKKGRIIAFNGELGSGKTTLIKGIVSGLNGKASEVTSPTFVYLHNYSADIPIYHFDLYRLSDAKGFLALGFEEFLFSDGICLIEWSEKIFPLIQNRAYSINIKNINLFTRLIKGTFEDGTST